jgi:dolichyl-phosphate-mannose-protein mannosyltransferase
MDVHPPLAKLLLTLAGWLAGFDGEFDFKDIGKDYLEPGVPYVAMRMLPAICGILLVPTMFLTLKAVGCRSPVNSPGLPSHDYDSFHRTSIYLVHKST